jgi:hypothetical protein
MATIPLQAFHASEASFNLDIAAKFYVAGAQATSAVTANLANVPPITAIPAAPGVAATLLPHFSYESKPAPSGQIRSKFSLLLDYNEKLAAALGDTSKAIVSIPGVANVPNFKTSLANLSIPGATTLEAAIYKLAAANSNVTMSQLQVGTANYIKIAADYLFDDPTQVIPST